MKLGLIGKKLGHSYSAVIHGHFHRLTGLEGSYDLIEVPDSKDLAVKIMELAHSGYHGINVTIPYKEQVMPLCCEISKETKRIGSANTLVFLGRGPSAYNTDYFGFRRTLEIEGIDVRGGKWLVLGSGGSSKSVRAVLGDMGAGGIVTASRTKRGPGYISYEMVENLEGMQGIVNTTPVGMFPETGACAVDESVFRKFETAVDLIYNPARTLFIEKASRMGLKTANGLLMLVAQAVKAQEIWRSMEFPDDLIIKIYRLMEAEA